MPEMHIRQPGFAYKVCETNYKKKKGIQNLKKQATHDIFINTS